MNNGARKGGDPAGWKTVAGSPGLEDLWQLHFALAGGKEANVPDLRIANIEEHCAGLYLKVSARGEWRVQVFNPRNKYSKTYAASRGVLLFLPPPDRLSSTTYESHACCTLAAFIRRFDGFGAV